MQIGHDRPLRLAAGGKADGKEGGGERISAKRFLPLPPPDTLLTQRDATGADGHDWALIRRLIPKVRLPLARNNTLSVHSRSSTEMIAVDYSMA
jgi:hypothetical protein